MTLRIKNTQRGWQGPSAPARQAIEFQLQRNGTHVRW